MVQDNRPPVSKTGNLHGEHVLHVKNLFSRSWNVGFTRMCCAEWTKDSYFPSSSPLVIR